MVRWYDWVAAFIIADAVMSAAAMALFGQGFWIQFAGAVLVSMLWDIWTGVYCRVRKMNEQSR